MRDILFIVLFLFMCLGAFAQVSLISYELGEEEIVVRWKYYGGENLNSSLAFSIYRSKVFISNVTSFSNSLQYIEKIGTFPSSELKIQKGYFYFYDRNPNVGTNYYFVFLNKNNADIIEFYPEQNFSSSFVYYMPLPIVKVEFNSELGNIILTWDKVENISGYFIYKIPIDFNGNLSSFSPLISLSKDETLFIDVKPSDKSFKYIVVPFVEGLTNFYYFSKKNSVIVEVKTNLGYSYLGVLKDRVSDVSENSEGTSTTFKVSYARDYIFTNYVTNLITNFITNVVTNFVFVSNVVDGYAKSKSNVKVLKDSYGESYSKQNFVGGYVGKASQDFDTEFRKAVKEFNKGNYIVSKKMFYSILEIAKEDQVRGKVMVYIARCEYATGNKDTAIKILFKAKTLGNDDADFWLTRFLVNK